MRILILGGAGMLGHQLLNFLSPRHHVKVTLHQNLSAYDQYRLFTEDNAYGGIDVRCMESLMEVVAEFRPQAIINSVGIVKQRPEAKESLPSLEINALLPHRLATLCRLAGARLVHLSTDCVFNGRKGKYLETDIPDAEDLYGRTKLLGEVDYLDCLTLRTSIIGRELTRHTSLLDWFLSQTGTVKGYTRAIYSGFTTQEMSRIIEKILLEYPRATGIYHVSSDPISKYELLQLIREKLGCPIEIVPDEDFSCDRSLDSSRFRAEFNYSPPSWNDMIEELRR